MRAGPGKQCVFVPLLDDACGHYLLRENVEGCVRDHQSVEIVLANGPHQCGALDKFIARSGEDARLGNGSTPMSGAARALQHDGNRTWRTQMADQVDGSNVDAEFERGGGDEHSQLAFLQFSLRFQPQFARHAAMVCGDRCFSRAVLAGAMRSARLMRDPFGQPPRVDEHQRGAVFSGKRDDSVVDLVPHFIAGDGAEFAGGSLHRKVQACGDDRCRQSPDSDARFR